MTEPRQESRTPSLASPKIFFFWLQSLVGWHWVSTSGIWLELCCKPDHPANPPPALSKGDGEQLWMRPASRVKYSLSSFLNDHSEWVGKKPVGQPVPCKEISFTWPPGKALSLKCKSQTTQKLDRQSRFHLGKHKKRQRGVGSRQCLRLELLECFIERKGSMGICGDTGESSEVKMSSAILSGPWDIDPRLWL